jgi:hypothetical protein
MHNFNQFNDLLNEGFIIKDNIVFFDSNSMDFINTKFGKSKKMNPYTGKLPFGKFYTAYKKNDDVKQSDYNEILKAIKGQSKLYTIDYNSYQNFLKRTAIYLSSFILEENIDIILLIESSSPLVMDLVNEINKRLPKYYEIKSYNKAIFKNPNLDEIILDLKGNEDKFQDKTIKNFERILDKARNDNYFKISKVEVKWRTYIRDWLKMKDNILSKIIDANVCIIDDFVTTGATMKEASQMLEDAGAKSVLGLGILKG